MNERKPLSLLGRILRARHSLVSKLIFSVGLTLLISISIWAYFNIKYHKEKIMEGIITGTDKISNTVRLGAHYAMMLNSRDDINQIIKNIGKQEGIENIRIYNKEGQIKFSNRDEEVDLRTNIKDEACYICHNTEPPQFTLELSRRIRIFHSKTGERRLGVISPIYNEKSCSTGDCHIHPADKKVLGALDLVVSLTDTDRGILHYKEGIILLAAFVFILSSAIIFVFLMRFVNRPITQLIKGTRQIAKGNYSAQTGVFKSDEIQQLAHAINRMGTEIYHKEAELSNQKDEYQLLFECVPCTITVQDRDFKLIRYNKEFKDRFDPMPGDFCFKAYKGLDEKCKVCPVDQTFRDGLSHMSEEAGINKDGSTAHWIVSTTPIKNSLGEIVAAMEMCIDITSRKLLEEKLEQSEKKYYAIFNNIPNPVFVLNPDSLEISDCNESVNMVYGYSKEEIISKWFMDLFPEDDRKGYEKKIRNMEVINRAKHIGQSGETIFVNIRISPSEYTGKKVLLVTTSDITKRLEAETQLNHAGKMATLGEMATGVAHELNQPLTVMKTASSFLLKKLNGGGEEEDNPLFTMAKKINNNVDRAAKIINHMRQFARKSEISLEKVRINHVIEKALEMFNQQLKVRGIEVIKEMEEGLPFVMADPGRLEQVFVNLFVNARHAIEERINQGGSNVKKEITIRSRRKRKRIIVEVCDTGTGIHPEVAGKIFEPFFTTKEVGKGTGLGLSISYGILKEIGGDIRVSGGGGDDGACFILLFPVLKGAGK